MPQAKRGVVEIRMDRRQAFYVVVGSLLIVSVAFVVGLIVGQRMQILDVVAGSDDPGLAAATHGQSPRVDGSEALAADEPDDYTFYDELRAQPPRPLLLPSPGGIGEPAEAIRRLERNPPAVESDAEPAAAEPDAEPPAAAPVPEPEPETEPAPPAEPEQVAVADAAPVVADPPATDRLTRRVIRRGSSDSGDRSDEAGFFTVEAGLFPSFSAATELRNRLRSAGHDAIVTIVAPTSGERRYRVQVGSYTRRSEADDIASQIVDLGLPASVVREG